MYGYPLKLYVEKFDLWKRQTSVPEEEIGATMVGRLKGAANRLALKSQTARCVEDPQQNKLLYMLPLLNRSSPKKL